VDQLPQQLEVDRLVEPDVVDLVQERARRGREGPPVMKTMRRASISDLLTTAS